MSKFLFYPLLLLLLCFSLATANLNSNTYPPSHDSTTYTHSVRRQLQGIPGQATSPVPLPEGPGPALIPLPEGPGPALIPEPGTLRGPVQRPSPIPPPQLQGTFYITSVNSNLCLDVTGASSNAGTNVEQWYCNQQANQQWTIQPVSFDVYSIISVNSNLCLDVTGQSTNAGTNVEQWVCNGQTNQQWTITPTTNNAYTIVSVNSGLCLDVTGQSTSAGTDVEQWYCNGQTNQQWILQPV